MSTITVIDFETGGLSPEENPITEVGLINFNPENFFVNLEYQTYVKPYNDLVIDPIVYEKTQVREKDVMSGKDSSEVVKELIDIFTAVNGTKSKRNNTTLSGHNIIAFDVPFLEKLFKLNNKNIYDYIQGTFLDTLPLSRAIWPTEKNDLVSVCKRVGFDLQNAHGAMNDVRGNYFFLQHILKKSKNKNNNVNEKSGEQKKSRHYFSF